jgi:hypothetical protein
MRHTAICGLSGDTVLLPHYHINGMITENKITEQKKCVLISLQSFSKTFPLKEEMREIG